MRNKDRNLWLIAWAATLALHVAAFIVFQNLPPLQAATVPRPAPIQLVFAKPGPGARANQEPHFFSELPPDRADAASRKPEFLSNVTSRARDQVPDGSADLPQLQGESDAPAVKLEPRASAAAPQLKPSTEQPTHAPDSPQRNGSQPQDASRSANVGTSPPKSGGSTVRLTDDDPIRLSTGNSDTDQPEMSNPGGNASLLGNVSLNTTAWDYAPWLQRFGRQLMERWFAPPAYSLGILKAGGWGTFEVEISRSGQILRLDLLEEQGHRSLISAAENALRSMAPIEPLPGDFPEPTLILRIRMIYPKIRPR